MVRQPFADQNRPARGEDQVICIEAGRLQAGQAGVDEDLAEAQCQRLGFFCSQGRGVPKPVGQSGAFQILNGGEPGATVQSINLVVFQMLDEAGVGGRSEGKARGRRKLEGDTVFVRSIQSLENRGPATPADFASDPIASGNQSSGSESLSAGEGANDDGIAKEVAHLGFPFHAIHDFGDEGRIVRTLEAEPGRPLGGRQRADSLHQLHQPVVGVFSSYCALLDWTSLAFKTGACALSFSKSQRRASPKRRSMVRRGISRASAVSSAVKPAKKPISMMGTQSGCEVSMAVRSSPTAAPLRAGNRDPGGDVRGLQSGFWHQ